MGSAAHPRTSAGGARKPGEFVQALAVPALRNCLHSISVHHCIALWECFPKPCPGKLLAGTLSRPTLSGLKG